MAPPLEGYSKAFQAKAAAELEALAPPCARDVANEHCSATHRLVIDYGHQRDQLRAMVGK